MADRESVLLALCAILRDQEILLLRRAKPPYQGYWGMPGGKIRFGETIPEAACREAQEETGLTVRWQRTCAVATEVIQDRQGVAEAHFIMFVCLLAPENGSPTPGVEGPVRWLPLSHLDGPDIIPSDRAMLKHFVLNPSHVCIDHYVVERAAQGYRLLP